MNGKYLVYRIYNKKERPDVETRSSFYGWSIQKSVIKAFCKQRDKKKYYITKMTSDEIAVRFSENISDTDTMIDYIKLKSTQSGEELYLFLTRNEMRETEKKIQRLFVEQASLSNVEGDGNYLAMFLSLDEYYADALHFIGFRPQEIDILFPSANYHDDICNLEKVEEDIDGAYDGVHEFPQETYGRNPTVLGLSVIEDVANKIYYSIESFIKIMRDDM